MVGRENSQTVSRGKAFARIRYRRRRRHDKPRFRQGRKRSLCHGREEPQRPAGKRQRGEDCECEIAFAIVSFPANSLQPRQLCTFAYLPRSPQVFVRPAFFELAATPSSALVTRFFYFSLLFSLHQGNCPIIHPDRLAFPDSRV